ncbi:DUF6300 family protein [Streptomyces sp. NPDC059008]|uniref:DUF6300 family protein n=1 Tax=Streptomyces sp. NPDC059008 TaxID=3346693 RepID=UPI0036820B74
MRSDRRARRPGRARAYSWSCAACGADKPAVGALLRWFAEGGGRDATRAEEGARLLMEWTKDYMAGHGWF